MCVKRFERVLTTANCAWLCDNWDFMFTHRLLVVLLIEIILMGAIVWTGLLYVIRAVYVSDLYS